MGGAARHTQRKPRADAARNRERLLQAAASAFASKGPSVSLEEIAKGAGLGIGTLYRHFPTRNALIEQVYRNETDQLVASGEQLGQHHAPLEALRLWLRIFVRYLATKQAMAESLGALAGGTTELYAASATRVKAVLTTLAQRAEQSGTIRLTVEPIDLLKAIIGIAHASPSSAWEHSAYGLIDILIAGLRAKPPAS